MLHLAQLINDLLVFSQLNRQGLKKEDVGKICILDVNSYAAIVNEQVDLAVERLSAGKIKGKKFKVGKA